MCFSQHLLSQKDNISTLLWPPCPSFISQHVVESCREPLVSCRQDVGQGGEEASRPPSSVPGWHSPGCPDTNPRRAISRTFVVLLVIECGDYTMHHIHLWCCSYLCQQWSEWIHPQPVLWDVGTTHRQERSWKLCGAPVTRYVKQWCTIPSQKLSVVFHTLLISIPHSLQPDARETSHGKLKEPSEGFKTVLPWSPDKTGGRRSDWPWHCWTAVNSDRHVMGPSHERLGRRAVFLAPGVSSFPSKQISHSSVVFWQPVLRPAVMNGEVPGQELAPGLSLARHAKTAPLR